VSTPNQSYKGSNDYKQKSEILPNLATISQIYDLMPKRKFHGQTSLKMPKYGQGQMEISWPKGFLKAQI